MVIEFKQTAASKLYWAGRPAMRIVQALHWLKDTLPSDRGRIMSQLAALLVITGQVPTFADVMAAIERLERQLHAGR